MNSVFPTPHHRHDQLLVVAYATGDAGVSDGARLHELLDACAACATLAADVRAVRAATAVLPALRRPRDFRLSADQAARLRSSWRRLLSVLAGRGAATVAPVAASLTSLGVAGLLLASLPGLAPAHPAVGGHHGGVEQSAGPGKDVSGGSHDPRPAVPGEDTVWPLSVWGPGNHDGAGNVRSGDAEALQRSTPSALVILSGSFLIAGLGLFAMRWSAGRFG